LRLEPRQNGGMRLFWGTLVTMVVLALLGGLIVSQTNGRPGGVAPKADAETVTPGSTPVTVAPSIVATPLAGSSPIAGSATPIATPLLATPAPMGVNPCARSCLVRMPDTDIARALLTSTGERPSHAGGGWLWTVIARGTVTRAQAVGIPALLVNDGRDTLRLYVVRLPAGTSWSPLVGAFGEVIDGVDGRFIVRVDEIPADVRALANAGIWVEKLRPAAPLEGVIPVSTGQSIAAVELGSLLGEVEAAEIETTILAMQATSSTDGTAIGTRHYTTTGNVMAAEYLFTRLEIYGLRVWYEDFITPEGVLATNVVAEIAGRDQAAVYGVMAHFDSAGGDRFTAPGADDNATGVAALLEIARVLSGYELEHPVRFILVNAEETAILGSEAFVAQALADAVPLEGVFNIDAIGSDRNGARLILNSGPRSAWLMDLLGRVNEGYGVGEEIWMRQNPAIVTDDSMLRDKGFEAVLVARELYGTSPVHHTGDDVVANISLPRAVSVTQLVLLATAALVQ